mmetsp:Transcript_37371/g.37702  ORF Transcript_37371/g.37702 Transcript_37371/m.37702 type:complete len:215 (-) Transcript_37371:527-1171(-)
MRCVDWKDDDDEKDHNSSLEKVTKDDPMIRSSQARSSRGDNDVAKSSLKTVLYIGDSLFADLVDAKREFNWMTACITPEVSFESAVQDKTSGAYRTLQHKNDLLLYTLRRIQQELGPNLRTEEDAYILNKLEKQLSLWREEQSNLMGNPFGSVFRAKFQPSLFAHSLRRYCDLYMESLSCLRHYSPQHRFYPDDSRLLGHELRTSKLESLNFDF